MRARKRPGAPGEMLAGPPNLASNVEVGFPVVVLFGGFREVPIRLLHRLLVPTTRWRIRGGEPFDVLILSPAIIDGLITDGKILAETRTNLMRSGMGVEVRTGAHSPTSVRSKPSSALLNAKSIAYLKIVNRVEELD